MVKKIHLICNAHLDPTWLWEWEEGAAEAISTFKVAADLCEEYIGYVFNHNEAILYKWIEEYEPSLFQHIRELVKKGKWHIMGGWYLQPDCNMPSGEAFVRQILLGKTYFKEKFGVESVTAINFDPFGHTRGLVQIMKKSGYDSYIFCRPTQEDCPLPSDDFIWIGYDGSEIMAHRARGHYNSPRGKADEKVEKWIFENIDKSKGLILWGIGNHGGGPSRIDLDKLNELMKKNGEFKIVHSMPEEYFNELIDEGSNLVRYEKDLNAWAVGCYTSQVRIKQKYRLLENELFMLEKMMSSASIQGYLKYPEKEIHEATCDLMTAGFHDTLPGSSVQPVEESALRMMDHGLEIISRLRARAFFALAGGQKKAKEGEIPILIYNPHPFKIEGIFECEFIVPDHYYKGEYPYIDIYRAVIYQDGKQIQAQIEKEISNINWSFRRRVAFMAKLQAGQMNRFDCKLEVLPKKPECQLKEENGKIIFKTSELEVVINCCTGLIDKYKANGFSYLKGNAFLPIVIEDNDDTWGTEVQSFRKKAGEFQLMSKEDGTGFSGIRGEVIDSVRIIENGEVRAVIEAVLKYEDSFICQTYKLPKKGTELQVQVRVYWNEKSKMLKLSVPTVFEDAGYLGQVAYGVEKLRNNGNEVVAQKWVTVVSENTDYAFSCINDGTYGSDFSSGEMRLSLLRSPGYSGLPIHDRPIMENDRFSPRIDQGERVFNFWFNGGDIKERLDRIDREAMIHNEKPFVLSFCPTGGGMKPKAFVELSDDVVQITAFKKAENSEDYIIRLFEPTGKERTIVLNLPTVDIKQQIHLGGFEIKTLKLDMKLKTIKETGLMENFAD